MKDIRLILIALLLIFFVFGIAVNRTGEGIKSKTTKREAGKVIVDYVDAISNAISGYLGGETEDTNVDLETIDEDAVSAFKTMNEQEEVITAKVAIKEKAKEIGKRLWEAIKLTVDNYIASD